MATRSPLTVGRLEALLDQLAPRDLADHWDNVGLLLGDPRRAVRRILVALEITSSVLDEARRRGADTIVTHHPLLFRPFKKLHATHPVQRLVLEAARDKLALIAAHSNLDRSPEGTNRALADRIRLRNTQFLEPAARADLLKFAVFVPHGHETKIIDAVGRAGAGIIGNYSHCTFRSPGTGTYIPLEGADPFAGEIGRLEHADELRLECVVPKKRLEALVREVRAAHPYEEMAFDVYPLVDANPRFGLGLVGDLPQRMSLEEFARSLKRRLRLGRVQFVGNPRKSIRRVAIVTGSGGGIARTLSPEQADVFLTGELDHHDATEARENGLNVIAIGHFESEVPVVPVLASWLRQQPPVADAKIRVIEARSESSPFRSL